MTISVLHKTAAFLAIALLSVACAAEHEPPAGVTQRTAETGNPSDPTVTPTEALGTATIPTDSPPYLPTAEPAVDLPDLGPAPEIASELWLNTDRPLYLASLKGEVVLVEFWTFG